jgi:hypothetical protein
MLSFAKDSYLASWGFSRTPGLEPLIKTQVTAPSRNSRLIKSFRDYFSFTGLHQGHLFSSFISPQVLSSKDWEKLSPRNETFCRQWTNFNSANVLGELQWKYVTLQRSSKDYALIDIFSKEFGLDIHVIYQESMF